MLKIGDFSKLCKVTIKALRYYDELGILKPDYIDKSNGYRYYNIEKLKIASEIITYKELGLSLEQISYIILNNPEPGEIYKLLVRKRTEVNQIINSEEKKLLRINSVMTELKGAKIMNEIKLKSLPEVIVASMRVIIDEYNDLHNVVPQMAKKLQKHGVVCKDPFYCFNIYHDGEHKETDIDVEICESVVTAKKDADGVIYKKIAKVETAACYYHKGPYSKLGKSYEELLIWIETNNYEMIDNPRESFIDGCWNKENPEDWLTEIQIPVKKKQL